MAYDRLTGSGTILDGIAGEALGSGPPERSPDHVQGYLLA
jgi:hypothetical protein